MFSFDTTEVQRFTVSLIGALILSTACVVAAVGPAQAAGASTPLAAGSQPGPQTERVCPRLMTIRL